MSTHGDIKIVNEDGSGLTYWLHAYSDGHSSEAFNNLKTLPMWLAHRAILSDWQRQQWLADNPDPKEWGSLGPWQLSVFATSWANDDRIDNMEEGDLAEMMWNGEPIVPQEPLTLDDKLKRIFRDSWRSCLGVNLDYCSAMSIAGYMVQRHFNRWNFMAEDEAPWHSVGNEPDMLVVCNAKEGYYDIQPSQDLLRDAEEFGDDDENWRFERCRVEFSDDLYSAFEAKGIELYKKLKNEASSGDSSVSEDE
jgi:hypothetical protein